MHNALLQIIIIRTSFLLLGSLLVLGVYLFLLVEAFLVLLVGEFLYSLYFDKLAV